MITRMLVLTGLVAFASPAARPAGAEDLVATFTALEQAFARGYRDKDTQLLEQLLAPEYTLTISARPDAPVSRADWLALIPQYDVRHFDIRGLQARCLQRAASGGCQLAAVSSVNTQQADVGGQDRSGEFFLVDLWALRDGQWVVLARYSGRTEAALPVLMQRP